MSIIKIATDPPPLLGGVQSKLERIVETPLRWQPRQRIGPNQRGNLTLKIDFDFVGKRKPNYGSADLDLVAVAERMRPGNGQTADRCAVG